MKFRHIKTRYPNLPLIIMTFAGLLCCITFLLVFGDFDHGNEGWYSNDSYLIYKGKHPYTDFFYHRLPLFIEIYALISKLIGISLLKLRLISGGFIFITIILTLFLNLAGSSDQPGVDHLQRDLAEPSKRLIDGN